MRITVVKESFPGERRVAIIPTNVPQLAKAGIQVDVEAGAGREAGYPDSLYAQRGATIVADRAELLQSADIIVGVRALGANQEAGLADLGGMKSGATWIGMCDPLGAPEAIKQVAEKNVCLFALELIPRITRAQVMDILSSQATIAGYRAVLLGAVELPKMFPMMMTAAGTLAAARVFVIGAGVAGLQAIATARRLGAIVHAYDVRPATREQIESLGGKFVHLELESDQAEDQGGYAKALGEEFYKKQRELMASVVAESDVVITTAAIPGKPSPLLITAEAVRGMPPGGVIVDLAAERGGNCELSQPDTRVEEHGITILGPTNLPAEVPGHASQMFSNNVTKFLLNMVNDGQLNLNLDDEIIRETLVCRAGQVVHDRIRQMLAMEPLAAAEPVAEGPDAGEPETAELDAAESDAAPADDPTDSQESES